MFENEWLGFVIIDRESRVSYANHAAENFLGIPSGSLVGMRIQDIASSVRTLFMLRYNRVVSDNVPARFEKLITPSQRLRFNLYPDKRGVIVTVEDITKDWMGGEAARMALLTINSIPHAVFIVRYTGCITNVNDLAGDITGYSLEELHGMKIDRILPGLDVGAPWGLGRRGGYQAKRIQESELLRRDGGKVPVEISVSEKKLYGISAYLIIAQDITDRKRDEAALINAKAQAELYLDLMGHDINNMHQIALGYLELALNMPLEARSDELLEKPVEVLKRSAQLIHNVRNLQKLKDGVFQTVMVDLVEVVSGVQREYGGVPGKIVTLNLNGREHCFVNANVLLYDVFANLVGNAIRHINAPSEIVIDVDRVVEDGKSCYRVIVEDNGPGIPDDVKGMIFNRMHMGTTKGMGLGLYLVKSLVDGYNGRVWVEDRVSGDHTKGARFVVMLPAADQ